MANETKHKWKFYRAGGLDQVMLTTNEDFANLGYLDEKLWIALSCPVKGLEFDNHTLEMIDTDKDGRIRVPEIIAAVNFVLANLSNPVDIIPGTDGLPLSSVKQDSALQGALKRMLAVIGKSGEKVVNVEDSDKAQVEFPKAKFNGDGIVPVATADDDFTKSVIEDVIRTLGGDIDASGNPGVNDKKLEAFYTALDGFDKWWSAGEAASSEGAGVLPLGVNTPDAFKALVTIRAKMDDYFSRCRIAQFDPRSTAALNQSEAEYIPVGARELSANMIEIAAIPLQQIGPDRPFDFTQGVNPAWTPAVAAMHDLVVVPVLGHGVTAMTFDEWQKVKACLAPYEAWLSTKKGAVVEPLGIERIRAILAGSTRDEIMRLIAQDLEPAEDLKAVGDAARLVHYYRDLYRLLKNFVNMADFYNRDELTIYQAGRLYLDQRTCHLCVRVQDIGAHSAYAGNSNMYLAYCNCTRPSGEAMTIVAAFSQGDSDYLMTGRRGIFYDRAGKDWDALITKVVENPISLRQAFFSPYKKLAKFISAQAEKFAASKEKQSLDSATAGVSKVGEAATPGKKPDGFDIAKFAGIFAAIGLAIGAIGGMLGYMLSAFFGLNWWQMLLALLGVSIVISGPSVLLAWLKLRTRTLGPLLEGNGWAINGRIKVNIPLGTSLTTIKKLPAGSTLSLDDPFEDKAAKRRKIVLGAILLLIAFSYLSKVSWVEGLFDWLRFYIGI